MAPEDLRDPLGVRFYPYYDGRDACARPCSGATAPGGGFTDADRPWLPLGDLAAANVAEQREDPDSVLALCRDVIAFRRRHPEFVAADYASLPRPSGRGPSGAGTSHVVVLNMSSGPVALDGLAGTVRLCTDRARDLEVAGCPAPDGSLRGPDPRNTPGGGQVFFRPLGNRWPLPIRDFESCSA